MKKGILLLAISFCLSLAGQAQQQPVTFSISSTVSPCAVSRVANSSTVGIMISGTWTGTLTPTVQIYSSSSSPTSPVSVNLANTSALQATITANGGYTARVGGFTQFSLCPTAWTSGTATVQLFSTGSLNLTAAAGLGLYATFPSGGFAFGASVTLYDPTMGVSNYMCLNLNGCINQLELTKVADDYVGGVQGGGVVSPTANLASVGRGNWRQQSFLGYNNLNNVNNVNTHKELAVPTYQNITADPGTHFQPIESLILYPNILGPNDIIYAELQLICTTCTSNAGTQFQVRISDPSTSCTITSLATTLGSNNQIWIMAVTINANGDPNGGLANLDIEMSGVGGTALVAMQKTSTCAVNFASGFAIGVDFLVASTNAAIIDTWTPYLVKGVAWL